jgi:hypothetical protein
MIIKQEVTLVCNQVNKVMLTSLMAEISTILSSRSCWEIITFNFLGMKQDTEDCKVMLPVRKEPDKQPEYETGYWRL